MDQLLEDFSTVTQSTPNTIIASDEHQSWHVAMLDCVTNPFQELLIVPAGHSLSAKGVATCPLPRPEASCSST
jgi:hypothetical protein